MKPNLTHSYAPAICHNKMLARTQPCTHHTGIPKAHSPYVHVSMCPSVCLSALSVCPWVRAAPGKSILCKSGANKLETNYGWEITASRANHASIQDNNLSKFINWDTHTHTYEGKKYENKKRSRQTATRIRTKQAVKNYSMRNMAGTWRTGLGKG